MGFFSSLCSAAKSVTSKVVSAVKSGAEKVASVVKSGVNKVKETASNMWSSFTGEKLAKEAKEIYERAKRRYERAIDNFNRKSAKLISDINGCLYDINKYKKEIYEELLVKFTDIVSKLHSLNIKSKEVYDDGLSIHYELASLKAKNSIIKIDFDEHRFKNNVKAILTFGILTRKQAHESKDLAEQEELKINEYILKMNSDLEKLDKTYKSLHNVRTYFKDLTDIFKLLIERLKYSLSYLRNIHLVFSYSFKSGKMDFRRLPKAQQKTFEVSYTLAKILTSMCQRNYISSQDNLILQNDINQTQRDVEDSSIRQAAAATA